MSITSFTYNITDNRIFINKYYQIKPTITGSTTTVRYRLKSGTLPSGIYLNTTSGYIQGTATEKGSYSITVTAYNDISEMDCSLSLRTGYGSTLQSTNMTREENGNMYLQVGKYYDFYCIFTGDITSVVWDKIINLPAGMSYETVEQDDGSWKLRLYGTPTTVENVRFRALVGGFSGLAIYFNVYVEELRGITIFNYPESEYEIYKFTSLNIPCECDGNFITYTYTNLPTGMSISSDGSIVGAPTVTGRFESVITATNDSNAMSVTITFNVISNLYDEDTYIFSTPNILITPVLNQEGVWTINGLPENFINSFGVISGSITKLNNIVTVTYTDNDKSLSQNIKVKVILKCYLQENKFDL